MKFLCVDCDEPMKIRKTQGPDEGSLTVIFGCPICQRDIAMLTNPWETQMLKSMDVKVGGKMTPTEPMSMLRQALIQKREELFDVPKETQVPGSKSKDSELETPASGLKTQDSGPGCPFSQMVSDAFMNTISPNREVIWTEAAEKRLERIPGFIRPMARKGIEMYAKERGYKEITEGVMDEARGKFGM